MQRRERCATSHVGGYDRHMTNGREQSDTALDRQRIDALVTWFRCAARDLPWRRHRTPYTALVAEAMLQQTQVARVVERFTEFIERFPTVESLAEADEQEVLAAWQGMGYYRRARHLHAAARFVVNECDGEMPRRAPDLQRLPGVGRYTAGAIASIACDEAVPIVDGNVQRVLARWAADDRAVDDRQAIRDTWDRAAELVSLTDQPGVFNEAMMELGAVVCTPRHPKCNACPVRERCCARASGTPERFPRPKRRAERATVHAHSVVVQRGDQLLLEQRPTEGLWSNMWQVPTIEAPRRMTRPTIERALSINISGLARRGHFTHHTTHRTVEFHVLTARTRIRRGVWRHPDDVDDLPMSNAQKRVLRMVCTVRS